MSNLIQSKITHVLWDSVDVNTGFLNIQITISALKLYLNLCEHNNNMNKDQYTILVNL